jgi:hypothetical protein
MSGETLDRLLCASGQAISVHATFPFVQFRVDSVLGIHDVSNHELQKGNIWPSVVRVCLAPDQSSRPFYPGVPHLGCRLGREANVLDGVPRYEHLGDQRLGVGRLIRWCYEGLILSVAQARGTS